MNLYYVTNGFTGNGDCFSIVIAENEKRACELASIKYKKDAMKRVKLIYPKKYWTNLKAELLHEDTNKEYASEIED